MARIVPRSALAAAALALAAAGGSAPAAERERVLAAAAEVMAKARYCAFVTLDAEGAPQARIMDPFPPEPDLSVWLATNSGTRKVEQMRRDPRVTLLYFDADGPAYVTLIGEARLVADAAEKRARFKPEWRQFYRDGSRGEDYLLIEVTPHRVELMSAPHEIAIEPMGWKPAIVELR